VTKKIVILLLSLNLVNPVYGYYNESTAFIVTSGMAVIAVFPIGIALAYTSHEREKIRARKELMTYMRKNHLSLVRDIALGRGLVITEWGANLKLSPIEQRQLERTLEGSSQQLNMLASLEGEIEPEDADSFSKSFYDLLVQTLGQKRVLLIVESELARMENNI